MAVDVNQIWIFRIIPIQNLAADLATGLHSKHTAPVDPTRVTMGNKEIISARDTRPVKCYPATVVNEYVPFYFSVRTPMLFNIKTGKSVTQRPQSEIVYLCCRLTDLAQNEFQWCFTDGNAAD